jgi:hypothetical protein
MDHHRGGAGGCRDPGRPVEDADRHLELLVALPVPHEAEERRVQRERDPGLAGQVAEALAPCVVEPEPALAVDLRGVVPALDEQLDRLLGALPRG